LKIHHNISNVIEGKNVKYHISPSFEL